MNIVPIHRKSDVMLGGEDLEHLYAFKEFPVFMGTVSHEPSQDIFFDMDWHISRSSGAIQLRHLLPLDIIYPEAHGSGCVGNLWMEHHVMFADFIANYAPTSVLEIGGAHGILSKIYQERSQNVDWTILEPNPTPVEGVKARIIKGFFDDEFQMDAPVDAVVHSHVFEHVYDPQTFVQHISTFLPKDKYLIFSLPNMEEMLRRKYTNCINFEHTVFLTEPYVEYLMRQHGFKLLARQYFLDDHSIFYACVRDVDIEQTSLPSGLYQKNKQLYLDYVSFHEELVSELNSRIHQLEADCNLYLFGAHVFAQHLIGFGLDTTRINCILDNDPMKQGKRLYGTDLAVASPRILAADKSPVVILKAGVYSQEIMRDILENINPNTLFYQ
jgi:hypothetical protein